MAVTTTLTNVAPAENGTIKISVSFTDEDGSAATPKTLTKTLTDSAGTIMNSIDGVAVSSLSSSMVFMLSGDDLGIPDSTKLRRNFLLKGTYDSSNGTDLAIVVEVVFNIKDMVGI